VTGYEVLCEALGIAPDGRQVVKCPAHDDNRESLSVGLGDDGRALLYCHAGCLTADVVKALGLEVADLFNSHRGDIIVAEYVYADGDGKPLTRVQRTQPKGFTQQAWDPVKLMWKTTLGNAKRVPYKLPGLLNSPEVWIVEGEKDADRMWAEGYPATTLMGGAGKWRDEYAQYFRGKVVHFVADNDKPDPKTGRLPGIEGVLKVKNALRGVAKGLVVYINPHGKDATDLFNAGFGVGDLVVYNTASDEALKPLAWQEFEVEETSWLFEPYLPKHARVLCFGTAGSLKSLWAMWLGKRLADQGHKVAYFSLEMSSHETAKRLQKLRPPPDRFQCYREFSFTSQEYLASAIDLFQGYSLIVVDSWSAAAAQMDLKESNQAIARMDKEVFQPLVDETGATLLILDNTGHGMQTDKGLVKPEHARGASAKGDKMELTIYLDRPLEEDNHTTKVKVKKMRLDVRIPKPIVVRTDPHDIDFRVLGEKGEDLGSMWDYFGDVPDPGKFEAKKSTLDLLREARDAVGPSGAAG
jgi:hypothetical protein